MLKVKTPPEFEYRLTIVPHFNEQRQLPTTLITLETTKQFASFRYELSVQENVQRGLLQYKILGLKAPRLSLPTSGTAQFIREYDRFKGKYEVAVEGLDGTLNEFIINFLKSGTDILKSPKSPFIELIAG